MELVSLPEGWLPEHEVAELQRVCRNARVLELGAWKGRSTVALSQVASHVVSVDRHMGIPEHDPDSLPDYLGAVRELKNVTIVVGSFENVLPLFAVDAFDVVFIDGDHDTDSVARDIHLSAGLGSEAFVFHDFDFPEVRDTVTAWFRRDPDSLVGSLAVYGAGVA